MSLHCIPNCRLNKRNLQVSPNLSFPNPRLATKFSYSAARKATIYELIKAEIYETKFI